VTIYPGYNHKGENVMLKNTSFLYRIQPTRPEMLSGQQTVEEERAIEDHFEYLRGLTDAGTVLLAGRTLNTDPSSFGIVIVEAESNEAARQIMLSDPAVGKGVMRAEIFPFRIALCSTNICKGS
jgi:uncharacterized protein YciI